MIGQLLSVVANADRQIVFLFQLAQRVWLTIIAALQFVPDGGHERFKTVPVLLLNLPAEKKSTKISSAARIAATVVT
jgi:hypothetical protein